MTNYFGDYNVMIDPQQARPGPDGRFCQDLTLVGVDEPPPGEHRRRAVAITLTPGQARELAFELLCLAELAEQTTSPTRTDEHG
jgi:hypothetical protein